MLIGGATFRKLHQRRSSPRRPHTCWSPIHGTMPDMTESEWFSAPAATPIDGSEQFAGLDSTILDFWQFAMSDLRMNNVRGYLAEFLVSRAVGASGSRVEWDAYDVLAPDGTKIEVK